MNLSLLANAANILLGMLRAVTGMTMAGAIAAELEGARVVGAPGGAIWLKSVQMAPLAGYMCVYVCKNDLPGIVHTYMDAAGCTKESS